jgi:hypothetical protein
MRVLGRNVDPSDGIADDRVKVAEEALGHRIPAALREYYRVAGKLDEVNKAHNELHAPDGLAIENGYLVFMDENQAVVSWGIRVVDLSQPDPEVWQRVNSDPPEWYSENMSFSIFMSKMLLWQAGLGDALE